MQQTAARTSEQTTSHMTAVKMLPKIFKRAVRNIRPRPSAPQKTLFRFFTSKKLNHSKSSQPRIIIVLTPPTPVEEEFWASEYLDSISDLPSYAC